MYYDDFYMPQAAGRRLSRGSSGQRASSAMRVVKPASASANNSPRSIMAARRRTMMNDGNNTRRQQQVLEYLNTTQSMEPPRTESFARQNRPLSWHPSSHLYPQGNYQYTPNMNADHQDIYFGAGSQFSPMNESYSTNTSPASTFSPLPAAFPPLESDQYFGAEAWETVQKSSAFYPQTSEVQALPGSFQSDTSAGQLPTSTGLDWNTFIMHGFNKTSPPTPEAFLQLPHHQPAPAQERQADYAQVEADEEEEGEILVGMGLYDTPDKHTEDPQLSNYRSTVTSLLGSTFRQPEARGKGLKLEETWEPPKSDDEEDEDDAEGEDEAAGSA
ncbi:hypothetical protein NQ176_g9066 [Zarea fungicola]|uniref:Uncharacterized protein n=1 Tax=Zarea fungicola TaxID=93591 RepID=A0ACC1MPZ3_9HYPO|nr:hypothetical protein NQ176_g9066 [Lecanicillium fungicola]